MRCPRLADLPNAPEGRVGWPWSQDESPPPVDGEWPLISVVVPSYNQGSFVEETLRSVLLQAYPDLELIVIDGGSEDESGSILDRYRPWLAHASSAPDGGQSEAISRGLQLATGELMTFIGSDDVYLPGALQAVAKRWRERPEVGAVVGAFRFLDAQSNWSSEVHPPRIPDRQPLDLAIVDPGSWRLHQVATFYTRQALDEVGRWVRPELRYTMDRELLYRICRRRRVALLEEVVAGFRKHRESKSLSQALSYAREMARLVWLDAPTDEGPVHRRQRRRLERYWLGRGYLKEAQSEKRGMARAGLLAAAAAHDPRLLLKRHYGRRWLEALGVLLPLQMESSAPRYGAHE